MIGNHDAVTKINIFFETIHKQRNQLLIGDPDFPTQDSYDEIREKLLDSANDYYEQVNIFLNDLK